MSLFILSGFLVSKMSLTQILSQRELEKFAEYNNSAVVKVISADGSLIGGATAVSQSIQGPSADNSLATGSPVPMGAIYRATATTYNSGDISYLHTDVNGNLKVTNAALQAGEDLTNDVTKVEQRYSYAALTSLSTLAVKGSAGFLHAFTIGMPSCPTINFYDSLTATGTPFFRIAAGYPMGAHTVNISFNTALSTDALSGGVIPFLLFSYR